MQIRAWLPEKWDEETDVLVAGLGLSGVAAAIEAHDAKAAVFVLEKMPKMAGASWITAGIIQGAGTSVQRRAGIMDSSDEMYEHWIECGGGLADPEHVRIVADKSADAIEWMMKFGAEFPPENLFICPWAQPDHSVRIVPPPRAHHQAGGKYTGFAWRPLFEKAIEERKIPVLLNTAAKDLIADPITKEVVGIRADSNGKIVHVKARKAVVLACGSIMRDMEMVRQLLPIIPPDVGRSSSPPSSTGDGIKMAQKLGADVINMSGSYYGLDHDLIVPCEVYFSHRMPYPSIFINKYGWRFIDECRQEAILASARQQDYVVYQIFDEEVRTKLEPLAVHHRLEMEIPLTDEARKERLIQASSITELASKIEVHAETLIHTIDTWNRHAEKGEDPEFGRGMAVGPIKSQPFYAFKVKWRLGSSQSGGVRVNTRFQVIDVAGKAIPRLYAVGRTVSGPFGKYYPAAGAFITHCVVSGRIAGENATAEKPW